MKAADGSVMDYPSTKEEAWRASGNEPGWVLAAGGQMVS